MHVPLLDLKKQYQSIKPEIDKAIQDVLDSGSFILGENVRLLEEEIAAFTGVKLAVGVASGTDALELSLMALGIGQGDEVITTPFTFIATAEAICAVGAKPVFCDIKLDDYNIDPKEVRKKISKKTKAIIPVHLYGHPCRMDELLEIAKEYNLKVIEDCAQAIGSEYKGKKVGSFGDCGAFSFFPSKNLGAYGDGGIAVTSNKELADKMRILRVHGAVDKYHHSFKGRNSRLDELQAAILRVKLKYLDKWNEARRKNAAIYNKLFLKTGLEKKLVLPKELPDCKHTYHVYAVRSKKRDKLQEFLKTQGVATLMHYPIPIHIEEVYKYLGYKKGDFPNAELVASTIISLPMYPELKEEEIEYVVEAIKRFYNSIS
ncbi:MAG: DegT/DnrJ/EryC1/StrS family aminotransferase [Candidatus Omnitrophota bacterium]